MIIYTNYDNIQIDTTNEGDKVEQLSKVWARYQEKANFKALTLEIIVTINFTNMSILF